MRRVAAGVVLAVVAGAGGWALARDDGGAATAAPQTRTSTAKVTRKDLAETLEVKGALGFANSRPVVGRLAGTVTALAAEGSTVGRGQPLYEVDGKPVLVLFGAKPAWRDLGPGVSAGADVRQLEENLAALGHAVTVDDTWTAATTAAVKAWRGERTVPLGSVVFVQGPVRVAAHDVEAGAPAAPGSPVMTVTSTERVVSMDLDARRQALVAAGRKVTVELPGGRTVPGTIRSVGTVATAADESSTPTLPVTIAVADARAAELLDQAPVSVRLTSAERKAALAVPVGALLALAEGGYAVEVDEAGARRLVAVRTGMHANGWVEVTGVAEGTTVVVPA